jgi:Short C-terminal domain
MPGLPRGVARTAVVAGAASAVSNRVSRRQYNRWSDQNEAYAEPEPAPAPAPPDRMTQLRELGELNAQGILTEQEFAAEKAKILGQ